MLIGKVLRIGYITREKVPAANTPIPVDVSINGDAQTAPLLTGDSLLEVSEQAGEISNLEKTGMLETK